MPATDGKIRGGAILIARRFFESWAWDLSGDQIKVFLYLLYRARWKQGVDRWWDGHEVVEIDRGSAIISTEKVAVACHVSRKTVRRTIEILSEVGTIRANTKANRWTLVKFLKYDVYQYGASYVGQPSRTQGANRGPTEGQPRATEGIKRESREEKTPLPPASAGASPPRQTRAEKREAERRAEADRQLAELKRHEQAEQRAKAEGLCRKCLLAGKETPAASGELHCEPCLFYLTNGKKGRLTPAENSA